MKTTIHHFDCRFRYNDATCTPIHLSPPTMFTTNSHDSYIHPSKDFVLGLRQDPLSAPPDSIVCRVNRPPFSTIIHGTNSHAYRTTQSPFCLLSMIRVMSSTWATTFRLGFSPGSAIGHLPTEKLFCAIRRPHPRPTIITHTP
jgi:hypothetical protein